MISSTSVDYLRLLATQTQNGHARHIRMMNVSRKNSAQVRRVFARRAAALLVRQKFDAIDILENFRRGHAGDLRLSAAIRKLKILQLRPISLRETASPSPQPAAGKSAAAQIPTLPQTPVSKRRDCGSRKTPAAQPANDCASRPAHRRGDSREMSARATSKRPAQSIAAARPCSSDSPTPRAANSSSKANRRAAAAGSSCRQARHT